jgi:hypothetical protein
MIIVCSCTNPDESDNLGTNNNTIMTINQREISYEEFIKILNGNLFICASYVEDGLTTSEILGGLIIGLALNGVDFNIIDKMDISFQNGEYVLKTGNSEIKLIFYFAEDYDDQLSGEQISTNLFDQESYITDLSIIFPEITYSEGPLFNLINTDISFEDNIPHFYLDFTKIAIQCISSSFYSNNTIDTLLSIMTTNKQPLHTIYTDFYNNGCGFSYDYSYYVSSYYDIRETLNNSFFYMIRTDSFWYWEGWYSADIIKGDFPFYIKGLASNKRQNYTAYFSDPQYADSFGVALHDLSLEHGTFYSIWGDTIEYVLEPISK